MYMQPTKQSRIIRAVSPKQNARPQSKTSLL